MRLKNIVTGHYALKGDKKHETLRAAAGSGASALDTDHTSQASGASDRRARRLRKRPKRFACAERPHQQPESQDLTYLQLRRSLE